jgi:ATP-dependent RNA helicase SUPV3L1/SUV3
MFLKRIYRVRFRDKPSRISPSTQSFDVTSFPRRNFSTQLCKVTQSFDVTSFPRRNFSTQPCDVTSPSLTLSRLSHFRNPAEFYPDARRMKRHFILHVGPTNSGKTFHALESLRKAKSGIYCGPLRLLAYEVFEKLNALGCKTDLVTGQEVEIRDGSFHTSCTIEMCNMNDKIVDVAVVDEIQLLGDQTRGWAWTRALLGINSKEIHLCGDESAVSLITEILNDVGDTLEVRHYKRLSPLKAAPDIIHSLSDLRPGDCVIAFGRKKLFEIKKSIEKITRLNVGVLYGSLPPSIRREQARRFNGNHTNSKSYPQTDILVATDAVGMGLNLAIDRVIFSEVVKFDGKRRRSLTISEVKQIGGRAGRGKSRQGGLVTCFDLRDLKLIKTSLNGQPTPSVIKAGLMPTLDQLELFAAAIAPKTLLNDLIEKKRVQSKNNNTVLYSDTVEPSDVGLSTNDTDTSIDIFDNDIENAMNTNDIRDLAVSNGIINSFQTFARNDMIPYRVLSMPNHTSSSSSTSMTGSLSKRFIHTEFESDTTNFSHTTCNNRQLSLHRSEIADWILTSQYIKFSQILRLFIKHATLEDSRYFISDMSDMIRVAQLLDDLCPVLSFRVLLSFVQAPVDTDDPLVCAVFRRYAQKFSQVGTVNVSIRLPTQSAQSVDDLATLESAHAVFELYLWLARKFSVEFKAIEEAKKGLLKTQQLIQEGLERLGRKDRTLKKRKSLKIDNKR